MDTFFNEQQRLISSHLLSFLRHKKDSQKDVTRFGSELPESLEAFVTTGSMMRGSLCVLGYQILCTEPSFDIYKLAAGIELYHLGLEIHDDIIDQDTERRGQKSLFFMYQDYASTKGIENPKEFGPGMGIRAGDVAFFFALESLANLNTAPDIKRGILNLFSREFVKVGLMQMQDIFWGYTKEIPCEEDILKLYSYKTGHYTFSLPLISGAMLAKAEPEFIKQLDSLGENFGVIYQLIDDRKDIIEKQSLNSYEFKKSLYYPYLMAMIDDDERRKIQMMVSKNLLSPEEHAYLMSLINKLSIQDKYNDKLTNEMQVINQKILTLPINDTYKTLLHDFLSSLSSRV